MRFFSNLFLYSEEYKRLQHHFLAVKMSGFHVNPQGMNIKEVRT